MNLFSRPKPRSTSGYSRWINWKHRPLSASFLREEPLVELYDSVLIPALSMAEQDRHKGAIDAAREEFLFLSINEMIAEFSEYQAGGQLIRGRSARGNKRLRAALTAGYSVFRPMIGPMRSRPQCWLRSWSKKGSRLWPFPSPGLLLNEWIALIEAKRSDVVCISALPPYAFAPARAMCKQIRERFPKLKVVVCVWGFSGRYAESQGPFRANSTRSPVHQPGARPWQHVQELVQPKPKENLQIA